jgi:hypothetical protein
VGLGSLDGLEDDVVVREGEMHGQHHRQGIDGEPDPPDGDGAEQTKALVAGQGEQPRGHDEKVARREVASGRAERHILPVMGVSSGSRGRPVGDARIPQGQRRGRRTDQNGADLCRAGSDGPPRSDWTEPRLQDLVELELAGRLAAVATSVKTNPWE